MSRLWCPVGPGRCRHRADSQHRASGVAGFADGAILATGAGVGVESRPSGTRRAHLPTSAFARGVLGVLDVLPLFRGVPQDFLA